MNRIAQAALVGAATGALASLPTTFLALKVVRKGSNVLLLAPADQKQLEGYARAFGAPVPDGAPHTATGVDAAPARGPYL